MKRWPAEVGLKTFNCHRILLEVVHAAEFDLLARLEGDDGFFPVRLFAGRAHAAAREVLELAPTLTVLILITSTLKISCDREADLGLGRARVHFERVLLDAVPASISR
jgi:hypothetical protein